MEIQIIAIIASGILYGCLGSVSLWNKDVFFGHFLAHSLLLPPAICIVLNLESDLLFSLVSIIFAILFSMIYLKLQSIPLDDKNITLGIVSLLCNAVAILLVNSKDRSADLIFYAFGDILLLSFSEVVILLSLVVLVVACIVRFWRVILIRAIDQDMAFVLFGSKVLYASYIFYFLQSLTIVLTIKIMGVFLIAGTVNIAAIIARIFAKSPMQMMLGSIAIACCVNVSCLILAWYMDWLVASTIVLGYAFVTCLSLLIIKLKSRGLLRFS